MHRLPPFSLPLLLLAACGHQYLVIPGAETVAGTYQYAYSDLDADPAAPTYTVVSGTPDLTIGQSVVLHIDLNPISAFDVTEILFVGLDTGDTVFSEHWRLDLTDEEMAAGAADVEILATDEKPDDEVCTRDYRGVGTCYQKADEGVTELGVAGAGGDKTSGVLDLPIQLDPMDPGTDACADFTVDDCCAGDAGISAVACYVDSSCDCPSGTTFDGTQADGTSMCTCP